MIREAQERRGTGREDTAAGDEIRLRLIDVKRSESRAAHDRLASEDSRLRRLLRIGASDFSFRPKRERPAGSMAEQRE